MAVGEVRAVAIERPGRTPSFDAGLRDPERPPGILWPLLERLVGDPSFPLSRVEVVSVIL